MDYKETLNLPRTEFSMKADLVTREPDRLARWEASHLYARIQANRAGAPKFVLHDGPPFANGDVHIGTALNKILKDMVVKYHTLRGYHAPYVPGWDCHGLPIEFKVSQEMRRSNPAALDAASIRQACEAYARKYIDIQRSQFKRLGVLGDWDNPYLTFDRHYEADELRLFADLIERGFVFRGKKPVYWSIPCRTALAEAEVEYQDHLSQSIFVKFPVVDAPGLFVLIWTTTPWTLPANLAVAFNSTFSYSVVRVGDETYIVSSLRLNAVAEQCGWGSFEIVRSLAAEHLAPITYHHPFCNRTGRLYPGDDFVDNLTGTGFVHVAPGHGLEDYALGRRVGLPIYSPVDDDGRFAPTDDLPADQQLPTEMVGKSILERHGRSDANDAVLHELRLRNALLHQENYHHSYPHCWRSKTPVIFRAMNQWFIRIDHPVTSSAPGAPPAPQATFRSQALEAVEQVRWIPDWGKSRIEAAVRARPDWCISRQRSWGVPIPAFYTADGQPILEAAIVRKAAELIEEHGSNVWFERQTAELWRLLRPEGWTGPEPTAKSTDTLDVWIDSGSSSRSVIQRRPDLRGDTLPFQADLYLEGSDQHRGWFQSSLLLSLAANGAPPYRHVLTHGFMVDADREKISKSRQGQGGYEKPQTSEVYVRKWGVDVLRLWVASQDCCNDIIVSEDRIAQSAEIYRLLRNTLRYQLANLYDFDPTRHLVSDAELTGLDRWILDEFSRLEGEVLQAYDHHQFHVVYQRLSQFAAVELSAVYHDIVKDRLYTDPANSHRRRSTQTALYRIVTGLCRMLAPILAFTADEAWEQVPGHNPDSVHLLDWQPTPFIRPESERQTWKNLFALREAALPFFEKARQSKLLGKTLEARLVVTGPEAPLQATQPHAAELRELLNVSQLEIRIDPALTTLGFEVNRAEGTKCERCWHWETDVGHSPTHPTLCQRCVEAVTRPA